jgi:hypothetical protein
LINEIQAKIPHIYAGFLLYESLFLPKKNNRKILKKPGA